MPFPAERPSEAQDRREVILNATLRVIGTGGVDSVTHRRVAAAAGIPVGSISYYFASREELFAAAFRHYLNGIWSSIRTLERDFAEGDASLVDALVALSAHDLKDPERAHAEYEMYVYAGRNADVARAIEEWDTQLDGSMARYLEAAGIARPVEAAGIIRGAIRGFELERLSKPLVLDVLRRRLEVTLNGLDRQDIAGSIGERS